MGVGVRSSSNWTGIFFHYPGMWKIICSKMLPVAPNFLIKITPGKWRCNYSCVKFDDVVISVATSEIKGKRKQNKLADYGGGITFASVAEDGLSTCQVKEGTSRAILTPCMNNLGAIDQRVTIKSQFKRISLGESWMIRTDM